MKKLILFSLLVVLWNCSRKYSPTIEKTVISYEKPAPIVEDKCAGLDTLLARSWRLANSPDAAYFRFYERNDTLVNKHIIGKFRECLIGKKKKEIIDKFREPTYKGSLLIYYKFFITDNSLPLRLRFSFRSDTVYALAYENVYKNCFD